MKLFIQARLVLWSLFLLLLPLVSQAQQTVKLTDQTQIIFAAVTEGQRLLSQPDEFVLQLSPFDRAARLQTDKSVAQAQYLEYVHQQVLPWQAADLSTLQLLFQEIKSLIAPYKLPLPTSIILIKTSGEEEGMAAYTRANAIIFGDRQLNMDKAKLKHLLIHELFHVMSRHSPKLRDALYQIIGFYPAKSLAFPQSLLQRKITNPDAPLNQHYINLKHNDKTIEAMPILFSNSEKYDMAKGGRFFDYLQFKLLVVELKQATGVLSPVLKAGEPQLLSVKDEPDYFRQIGENTHYIIHPEEILADNFALVLLPQPDLKSPQIPNKMKTILETQSWH